MATQLGHCSAMRGVQANLPAFPVVLPASAVGRHAVSKVHTSRSLCCCNASKPRYSIREQKDPSRFSSMDEAREYLHQRNSGAAGPIAGFLNFLSNTAFGAGKAGLHLGSIYRQWLHLSNQRQRRKQDFTSGDAAAAAAAACAAACPDVVSSLAVLMFMSEHRVCELAAKYPQVLAMPPGDVAQRLLLLKQLLPHCDVARMIELQPGLLLGCEACYLREVVGPRLDVLTAGLPGADIPFMVQEDPRIMFEEVESSLPRLHELWPGLDADAFAASDPAELALALRALSDKGPPKRY